MGKLVFKRGGLFLLMCVGVVPMMKSQNAAAYMNPDLPVAQRVQDLLGRMTTAEKISQLQSESAAVPRLGIPEYDWWNEGLHGVARSGYATVFPQAIGLAATWDTKLIHEMADVVSTEARAKYNQAQREGNRSIYYGLTFWSPNINIYRDPRWGRGQETYGEDPFLTGSIGAAFVRGMQGDDPKYLKVVATAKHYAVHSGPEGARHKFDVPVTPHDLEDTYLPAFRKLVVEAQSDSVMCAYNAVSGKPACASDTLLAERLRGDWGFKGYVVSDCAAITDVAVGHKFAPDMAHAAAVSLKAGTDVSCGKEYAALSGALEQKLVTVADLDLALGRLLEARFRLGMFDPAERVKYSKIAFAENDSAAHAALALKVAERSMVLLKNDGVLPLAGVKTVAVIGPNAAALPALEGNYNAIPSHPMLPVDALMERMPGHVVYAQGSPYVEGASLPVPRTLFGGGLKAEYFDGAAMTGKPVFTRTDAQIDFDWNAAAPVKGVSAKSFGVRWTGTITTPVAGKVNFGFTMAHCSTCDDAEVIRVWMDGKSVYTFDRSATRGRRAPTPLFSLDFADTKAHALRVEYTHTAPLFGAGVTLTWQPPVAAMRAEAVAAARKADVVVAVLGLSPELEGEEMPVKIEGFAGGDRSAIELPKAQQALMDALVATGKPVVVVLMNGSAVALGKTAEQAKAVLEAWYPGEAGGTAIVRTLFGENNPSGRLPVTFYASTSQLPGMEDYSMAHRTYRYFTGEPLYAFGYGLSYTKFGYGRLEIPKKLKAGEALEISVEVRNEGQRDGEETVEAYLVPKGMAGGPLRELVGFEKVMLKAGEKKTVKVPVEARSLSLVGEDGVRAVRAGEYELVVGGGMGSNEMKVGFEVVGEKVMSK